MTLRTIERPSRALLAITLLATPAAAQLGTPWAESGPRAFGAEDIETSPTSPDQVALIAGSRLALTDDGGLTFTAGPASVADRYADLEFAADGRLYAADGPRVRVSLDGGQTFALEVVVDGPGVAVNDIAADPLDPMVAWVGLDGGAAVARTADGGATWTAATPAGFVGACTSIEVDPLDGARILACQEMQNVFVSQNGGATWSASTAPIGPQPVRDGYISGQRIVLATPLGLFYSLNSGTSFVRAAGPVNPSSPTFEPLVNDIEALDAASGHLIATAEDGRVLESTDTGQTWTDTGASGFGSGDEPLGAGARPSGAPWIGRAVRSLDALDLATGQSSPVANGDLTTSALGATLGVASVAIDPNDPDRLLAIASDDLPLFATFVTGAVCLSEDGGATWSFPREVAALAARVAIGADGRLWVGLVEQFDQLTDPRKILADDGTGWTEVGTPGSSPVRGGAYGLALSPTDPDFVVAVFVDQSTSPERTRVWISRDGAASWQLAEEVIESGAIFKSGLTDVAADVAVFDGGVGGPRIAYRRVRLSFVGRAAQLRVSNNGGASWIVPLDGSIPFGAAFEVAAAGEALYSVAPTFRPALNRSDDAGFSWSSTGPSVSGVNRIAASNGEPETVYYARGSTIERATASGADVESLDAIPGQVGRIWDLVVREADGDVSVAVAANGGLWLRRIPREIGDRSCAPATENSAGLAGQIRLEGSDSVQTNDLTLVARRLPVGAAVLPIFGDQAAQLPGAGGSQGTLCVGGSVGRFVDDVGFTGSDGAYSFAVDLTNLPAPTGATSAVAGDRFQFQCWYRDQLGGGQTSNYTDAVALTVQP